MVKVDSFVCICILNQLPQSLFLTPRRYFLVKYIMLSNNEDTRRIMNGLVSPYFI